MCLLYTEVFIKNLFVFLSVLFSAPSIRKMQRQAIICVHVRRAVTRRLYPRLRSRSVSESSSNHEARKFSRRLIASSPSCYLATPFSETTGSFVRNT